MASRLNWYELIYSYQNDLTTKSLNVCLDGISVDISTSINTVQT